MPARADVDRLVRGYVSALGAQDVDGVLAFLSDDAIHDDVAAEGAFAGTEAIRSYLEQLCSVGFAARLDGPVAVHGASAGFRFVVEIPAGRTPFRLLATAMVDVVGTGDEARISRLRAVSDSQVLNG